MASCHKTQRHEQAGLAGACKPGAGSRLHLSLAAPAPLRLGGPADTALTSHPSLKCSRRRRRCQQEPIWDLFESKSGEDGSSSAAAADGEQQDPRWAEVPAQDLERLHFYRPFACLLYYIFNDDDLAAALEERGG